MQSGVFWKSQRADVFFSHPSSDLSEALLKQPKKSFTEKQARCIS
jgi:hypothetical protein